VVEMFEKVSQEGFELTTTRTPIAHANDINLLQKQSKYIADTRSLGMPHTSK